VSDPFVILPFVAHAPQGRRCAQMTVGQRGGFFSLFPNHNKASMIS